MKRTHHISDEAIQALAAFVLEDFLTFEGNWNADEKSEAGEVQEPLQRNRKMAGSLPEVLLHCKKNDRSRGRYGRATGSVGILARSTKGTAKPARG